MSYLAAPKLEDEAGRLAALHRYALLDTDPEREFEDIIRLVRGIFGVPMAAISLIAEERQWFKAAAGLDGATETPRSTAFCHYTIKGTASLAVENAPEHPLFAANPLVTGAPGIRCYLGAPLTTPEGYNVGALCIIGTERRSFSPADGEVLANFARLVVSQMELRAVARRDSLTGALSRRAFEDALRRAIEEAGTEGAAPSLLLFDIDHFKVVNDRFGHPAGDEVIRAVVGAMVAELGRDHRLGRLGGEEFGILLPRTARAEAAALAERIRARVAALDLPVLCGLGVTVSGSASSWASSRAGVEAWMAAADLGLYSAKRTGRNRVAEV